jgi:hypothetical protein
MHSVFMLGQVVRTDRGGQFVKTEGYTQEDRKFPPAIEHKD